MNVTFILLSIMKTVYEKKKLVRPRFMVCNFPALPLGARRGLQSLLVVALMSDISIMFQHI